MAQSQSGVSTKGENLQDDCMPVKQLPYAHRFGKTVQHPLMHWDIHMIYTTKLAVNHVARSCSVAPQGRMKDCTLTGQTSWRGTLAVPEAFKRFLSCHSLRHA